MTKEAEMLARRIETHLDLDTTATLVLTEDDFRQAIAALRAAARPAPDAGLVEFARDLAAKQQPLGAEFGKALDDNRWELYAKSDAEPVEREAIAVLIWHRFGNSNVQTFEEETHKAEYLLCADAILALLSPRAVASEQDIAKLCKKHADAAFSVAAGIADEFACINKTSFEISEAIRSQATKTPAVAGEPVAKRSAIPTCCVTGAIPGDGGACGDCDPCIFGEASVPEAVKRLIAEKNRLVDRNGELEDAAAEAAPSGRDTFTIPDGFEAVRDAEGRATGDVRRIEGRDPATIEAATTFIKAWDSLPIGEHGTRTVNNWLCSDEMVRGVAAIRALAAPAVVTEEG